MAHSLRRSCRRGRCRGGRGRLLPPRTAGPPHAARRASQPDRIQPLPTASASTDGAPTALSEERSVALALLWNRGLRAFRLTRGVAEGKSCRPGALANPGDPDGADAPSKIDLGQLGWDVRLMWEPPRPGVRSGRVGAARPTWKAIGRQVGEREWGLTCDVRTAHAESDGSRRRDPGCAGHRRQPTPAGRSHRAAG